jgi:predicted O-linked N-acetylglucosamine transferase (SPINDLY family)
MFHVDDPSVIFRAVATPRTTSPTITRPPPAREDGKQVVCYLSADIRAHPVAQMLLPVLRAHDRTRFHLVLGALAPQDSSTIAQAIYDLFDEVIPLYEKGDREAAQTLQSHGVHTIVDLGGVTLGSRSNILSFRPAPRQFLWLGCPITTGLHHYDAWVVDAVVAPPGYETFCTEPLVRLPVCYHPISLGESAGPSDKQRVDFLWPEDGVIVGLLMQPSRITAPFLRQMVAVVAPHPNAVLVLRVAQEHRSQALATLDSWGLPEDRVRFIQHITERADYLALIRNLDLFVDSVPYGGHSTVGEALQLGVPVVSCWGSTVHSRVAGSMMTTLGLADLIAQDFASQLRLLHTLIGDPELRRQWKARFALAARQDERQRHHQLTRHLERTYHPD